MFDRIFNVIYIQSMNSTMHNFQKFQIELIGLLVENLQLNSVSFCKIGFCQIKNGYKFS